MKNIFTRTDQPLVLEFLGYAICGLLLFMVITISPTNWQIYPYALIGVVLVGGLYRLLVAYPAKVQEKLCGLAGKAPHLLSDQEKIRYSVLGSSLFI